MFDALLLRLGRATAATLDVPAALADVCRTLRPALGVRGVVVAVGHPADPAAGPVAGSDDAAAWIARVQRDARGGPLAAVTRSGRPLRTGDLLRVGPPELAAAAAEAGITEAMTVPLVLEGRSVGALQLLGDPAHPVGPGHAEPLGDVLDVLAARLVDVEQLRRRPAERTERSEQPEPAPPEGADDPEATTVLPITRRRPGAVDARRGAPAEDVRPSPVPRPEPAVEARPGVRPDARPDVRADVRADVPDHEPVTDRLPDLARLVAAIGPAEATSVLPAAVPDARAEVPADVLPAARPGVPAQQPRPSTGLPPAPRLPDAAPPVERPPGPEEIRVPVPRYHEPGAQTFGAAADREVDGDAEAEPSAVGSGAGAPASGSGHDAADGTPGPRRGRRRREP